ncbi:putative membrane protein [Streptacidiphilus sp. MAP12-16]|uniref:DUF2079 domain-containing protein n=1 Tax=Streptacidiphilus sp. MAP12-16 TaxID=3156300 RepID=UPI00351605E8
MLHPPQSVVAPAPARSAPVVRAWWQRVRVQAWGLAGVFFALYCVLSVRRHQRMQSAGFDLGIFEQGIRAYAHGHAPVTLLKGPGFNLLGDHFHPLLVVFAPFYRLFPSPLTLLVGQAALAAVAIVPLVGWAHRVRGPKVSAWIGLAFGASWGMAELNHFDFHEVCLAVPLLAFALAAAGQQRWKAAAGWGLPLLLVKEDLGLTLALLGGYIAWKGVGRGPKRLGWALVAVGVLGSALEMLVILPSMNAHGSFDYWNEIASGSTQASVHANTPLQTVLHTFWPPEKYGTVLMLLAPTAFVALRSPLVLLLLPTLGWRFVSANPHYWGTLYHYNATLMVIVFAAAIHALDRDRAVLRGRLLRWLCAASAVFTAVTVPIYPLHEAFLPRTWTTPAQVGTAAAIMARIPDGAGVATSNRLAAQLAGRTQVSLICSEAPPAAPPEWVLLDATDPTEWPCPMPRMAAEVAADQSSGRYHLITRQDGITLLRRSDR